ncbi:hypothetical protein LTR91_025468 [Friedmanniomyces endolithicus]|uniref:Uncharacterized protein n=1 Tax=Friedmanniomyces endolithicus TaxID=329885 RepID=A0AAN6H0T9_9PEZI|nr:hypothetical protein LTR57_025247 [Friedmanniomyces endolithicus]KAK0950700.1 hypothetical protein LTR91_025468 [Friedmanniomyces endolithicus]KAK0952994.1 hypothetical protein LTS01_024576 [Friedmanniomyces endolithicus]KAK1021394.1 hypothetical protein LTS16_026537 [Friedmanniomyces endolithicus]
MPRKSNVLRHSALSVARNSRPILTSAEKRCLLLAPLAVRTTGCAVCTSGVAGVSRCDIRVTAEEFERLKQARSRLLRKLEDARAATSTAIAREQRLMKQLALVDQRAGEAIAVEERDIEELEAREAQEAAAAQVAPGTSLSLPVPPGSLALSPFTWSAMDGLDDGFWDSVGLTAPAVVGSGDTSGLGSSS